MFLIIRKMLFILSFVLSFTLAGCVVKDPKQSHVQNQIEQTLNKSIQSNMALSPPRASASKEKYAYLDKLKKSLVPQVSVNVDTPQKPVHRFNVSVNQIPAHTYFMNLVKDTKTDIVVDPDVKGNISLILNQVTVPEAIQAACDAYGFQFIKTDYGYRIQKRQLVSQIYNVGYLNVKREGKSSMTASPGTITSKVSGGGSTTTSTTKGAEGGSVTTTTSNDFWVNLTTVLKEIVGSDGGRRVVVNADSGTIYIKAYPNEQRDVSNYLDKIKSIINRQVIIEAKVLEIRLNAEYQSGIQWKLLGLNLNGSTQGDNSQDSTTPFDLDNFYSGKAHFTTSFDTLIQLLNEQGRVEVLSSPHIATMNNQKAVIKVGDDQFEITNVSSTTSGTSGENVSQDVDFTPFFSGIALDVTPEINKDNSVTLQIHPIISSVSSKDKPYTVNGQSNTVPLATSRIRESDSIVRAKNGQVVVIGGLMENSNERHDRSIPGVDNSPFRESVGRHNRKADKIEVVILLKPVIVTNDHVWTDSLNNAKNTYEGMRDNLHYTLGVGLKHG